MKAAPFQVKAYHPTDRMEVEYQAVPAVMHIHLKAVGI